MIVSLIKILILVLFLGFKYIHALTDHQWWHYGAIERTVIQMNDVDGSGTIVCKCKCKEIEEPSSGPTSEPSALHRHAL